MPIAAKMLHTAVILSPIHMPITTEPSPEKMPFSKTICNGSFDDIFRVQLFSKPHSAHARSMKSEPYENRKLDTSSNDSNAQEIVINKMPSHKRALIFSLNIASAMIAVATISKLFSSDALAAVVHLSPSNKHMGAATSKRIIITVYGNSFFVSPVSAFSEVNSLRTPAITNIPAPAPIYKSPAISVGGMKASSIFEKGELIAYNAAANKA